MERVFNEERGKSEKGPEIIQEPQKEFILVKAARTAAENSAFLHSDSFEINTGKSQEK